MRRLTQTLRTFLVPLMASCVILKVAPKRWGENLNWLLAMHYIETRYFKFNLGEEYNFVYFVCTTDARLSSSNL